MLHKEDAAQTWQSTILPGLSLCLENEAYYIFVCVVVVLGSSAGSK